MTEPYPVLTSMGVSNPSEIVRYTVYLSGNDTDVLRIIYARPKGSILPVTRKYRFGRAGKSQTVDSGTRQTALIYEISPQLEKAIAELDQIIKLKTSKTATKKYLINELKRIQQDFQAETDALLKVIDRLDD